MPLLDLEVVIHRRGMPADARALLREASRRIRRFVRDHPTPGFIPSDYRRVFHALSALTRADLLPGDRFCEWGSGFGVATCLAAQLGLDAVGIEIDAALVEEAQQLAEDFGIEAEFIRGSFIP